MDGAKWALKWAAGGVLAGAGAAAYAQHARYARTRREVLGDRAPLLHGARCCVVLLRAGAGDAADAMRALRYAAQAAGAVPLYAGKARQTVLVSAQLPKEWDGFMILQFRSPDHAREVRCSAPYAAALAAFAAAYHVEFVQPPLFKVLVPQILLAFRAGQSLKGQRILPFTEASPEQLKAGVLGENGPPGRPARLEDIDYRDHTVLDNEPAVQLNLTRYGTAEDKERDQRYAMGMMNIFAAACTGSVVYYGRATWWDGKDGKDDGVRWDEVAVAHYPSRRFFMEMLKSTYWNGIVGDKKMRDTLCLATVPCKL